MTSILLRSVARIILPLAFLVAAHLLMRGHNLPGGGFVAGLMAASALILQFVATDRSSAESGLPRRPETLIWLGLLVATGSAIASLLLGFPLLTHTTFAIDLPLLGHVEIATAMFFDIGVFLVVSGITLAILIAIED